MLVTFEVSQPDNKDTSDKEEQPKKTTTKKCTKNPNGEFHLRTGSNKFGDYHL